VSDYTVVSQVSETLRQILWEAFSSDPTTLQIVGAEAGIALRNPTETARDSANRLSLWLYQISENEYLKNQTPLRTSDSQVTMFPPLALNFYYLITPFTTSGDGDHLLLGKTMQVLYDNSTIVIHDPANSVAEELRVIMCNLNLEQLTRIWEALQQPYRLSMCYQVRVTQIDSRRTSINARVVERRTVLASGLAAAGGFN
jgi:hypothetical protein